MPVGHVSPNQRRADELRVNESETDGYFLLKYKKESEYGLCTKLWQKFVGLLLDPTEVFIEPRI
jgi:hypothetical protein